MGGGAEAAAGGGRRGDGGRAPAPPAGASSAGASPADVWLSEMKVDKLERYVWHFDMLHHGARHEAFRDAFRRLPDLRSTAANRALDLGCGSGLLGLMLRAHAPGGGEMRITAVEGDKPLAKVASDNAAASGSSDRIAVRACLSTRLPAQPPAERAPVVVSELFDSPLLGEGVLPTMRHAAKNLLAPGYRSVPSRVRLRAVVVESPALRGYQRLARPGGPGLLAVPLAWRRDGGGVEPHEVNYRRLLASGRARPLTPEFDALTIDFEQLPPRQGQHVRLDVAADAAGSADAVVFWWTCAMLRGDGWAREPRGLTNAPGAEGDPDHWRQAVCVLPTPAGGRQVALGEVLHVHASHNDALVWFHLDAACSGGDEPRLPLPASSQLALLTPWRLRALNSPGRLQWLADAARSLAEWLRTAPGVSATDGPEGSGPLVIDLSEGGVMALLLGARARHAERRDRLPRRRARAISGSLARLLRASRSARARRRRPPRGPGAPGAAPAPRLVALSDRAARSWGRELEAAIAAERARKARFRTAPPRGGAADAGIAFKPQSWRPGPGSVSLLVAEPYDGAVEQREDDLQLWQHWAQVQDLLPTLRQGARVWPRRFRLRVAAVACEPLWARRRPVGAGEIAGVHIPHMDRLASPRFFPWAEDGGSSAKEGRARFPCELWQQDHAVLPAGEPGAVLCEVDVLEQALGRVDFGWRSLDLAGCAADARRRGVHALATWAEVQAPGGSDAPWRALCAFENGNFAPDAFKQGMLLASNPLRGHAEDAGGAAKRPRRDGAALRIDVRARFDPARGELRLAAQWGDGRTF